MDNQEWLKPSQIAQNGLITNTKGNADYRFVVRLIKSGKLKAKVYTNTKDGKQYWLVHRSEIEKYNQEGL